MPAPLVRQLGNRLYRSAFPLYLPVYGAFKAWEDRAERALLRKLLKPGDAVIDAGANIGIYTRFLSGLVGPGGEVHSFEPSAENFGRLKQVTSGLGNVHLNEAAVGAASANAILYVSDNLNVDHRAYPTEGEQRREVPVKTVALDDCFPAGKKIALLKMDIQGYEYQALLGAGRLIAANPGIRILLEYWPFGLQHAGAKPEELLELLRGWGFKLYGITEKGLGPSDPSRVHCALDSYTNLLAQRE